MPAFEEDVLHACQSMNVLDVPYVVIGGIAVNAMGEPRMTHDLDFLVFIPDTATLFKILDKGPSLGFRFDRSEAEETFKTHRGFKGAWGERLHLDFLVAGTAYEAELYGRKRKIPYHGVDISIPTPEDLILLKIMAGRDKDMLDLKNIIQRQGDKLDRGYIERWVDRFQSKRPDHPFKERWTAVAGAG